MNEAQDQFNWNEYFIQGTDVLKNKLGIIDKQALKDAEKEIVRKKLTYLYLKPLKGNFDKDHLLKIHEFIFDEIYYFAGKIRTCSMQKDTVFCDPQTIEKDIIEILEEMNKDFSKDILSIESFAFKLGKYYYDLIYTHPFREGNGRSIRVFIREFVLEKSKKLPFGPLDLDYTKMDKNNLLLGTVRRYLYPSMIEMEFIKGLVQIKENIDEKTY